MYQKIDFIVLLILVVLSVMLVLYISSEGAGNRYQSVDYPINDTLNDIINGIALGNGADGTKAGNLNAVYKEVSFPQITIPVLIEHNLGRTPVGYVVIYADNHAVLYDISGDMEGWDAGRMYLSVNAAPTTARILIF